MKKLNMIMIGAALCLSLSVFAQQDGNGGGGIMKDGRYMTFGSAGIYVESSELSLNQVPQLNKTIEVIMNQDYLNVDSARVLFSALNPSKGRKYFQVKSDQFSLAVRSRLMSEYSRLLNIDTGKIALFAITDVKTSTTYLLPEFYSLNPIEQMTILYHEAYWIVNPKSDYQSVVSAEVSFQKYLESGDNQSLFNWLKHVVQSRDELIAAAYGIDSSSGALNSIKVSPKEKNKGEKFLLLKDILGDQSKSPNIDESVALQNLYEIRDRAPNSFLIPALIEVVSKGSLHFKGDYGTDGLLLSSCYVLSYSKSFREGALNLNCLDQSKKLWTGARIKTWGW